MIKTVLFDLDGTLADTAPDLAYALNCVLEEQGHAPLPFETIRPVVSHGGIALIKLGFGIDETASEFQPLRQRLLDVYRNNIARETRLFDGMAPRFGLDLLPSDLCKSRLLLDPKKFVA